MKGVKCFFESDRALGFLLILFAFSIPLSYRLSLYVFGGAIAIWFFSGNWYYNIKNFKLFSGVTFLVVLWLLFVFSLVYTCNIGNGLFDVAQKLSLLLFPLIFLTSKGLIKYKSWILNAFILALLIVAFFLLGRALYYSLTLNGLVFNPVPEDVPWENYFLYFRFTEPYHPTYLSLYFSLGLAILSNRIAECNRFNERFLLWALFVFFSAIIYLSSSKAGMIVAALLLVLSVFWLISRKSRLLATIVVALLGLLVVFFLIRNSRMAYFVNYINGSNNKELSFENEEFENQLRSQATVRTEIWRNIPTIVGSNWLFGVGIGDVKGVLVAGYKKTGVLYAAEAELNAHNQYLETFVGIGIVGLAILLLILGMGFRTSFIQKDMLLFMFLFIILVNFIFESMFERVFGVMFFSFFYCLLYFRGAEELEV